ncbi:MAG: diguanylate cyclase [Terracidiphilus sp.]|nr:diguanylate cyclase [Terracidiphilus sp.]
MTNEAVHSPVLPNDFTFYKELLNHIDDGIYFVDRDRQILYWNRGAEQLTGYEASEALGRHCQDEFLCHVDAKGNRLCQNGCPLAHCIDDGQERKAHVLLRNKAGRRVPVRVRVQPMRNAAGEVVGAVEIFSDASAEFEMQRRSEAMTRMAYLDHLTQLPNRRFMENSLRTLLSGEMVLREHCGVLLIDVDGLKKINDEFGHNAGDKALQEVARTLVGALRPTDVMGRWGGDEFLAVIGEVSKANLGELARRCVMLAERARLLFQGQEIQLSVSVGGTLVRIEDDIHTLVERADSLLYLSKQQGRGRATMD